MNNKGFSLVELAISVMVIGILIGGVVKGREVLEAARAMGIASQITKYERAHFSFQDMFGGKAGDLATATTDIPNCSAANYCKDGNSDSLVGAFASSMITDDQTGAHTGDDAIKEETTQFWKHLALAGIINDVQINANPANPDWGYTHPKSKAVNAGFHVLEGKHVATTGFWLYLRKNVTGDASVRNVQNANAISPIMARALDRKIDDGMPDSGIMQHADGGSYRCDIDPPNTPSGTPNIWVVSYDKNCAPMILIDN